MRLKAKFSLKELSIATQAREFEDCPLPGAGMG